MTMNRLMQRLRIIHWDLRQRKNRIAIGWRFAWGTMTEDDAHNMAYECATLAGRYSLEELSRDSVLEQCRERFGDVPELPELVADACERVWSKWDSSGDLTGAAEDWAMDKVLEYAEQRGITLDDSWSINADETEEEDA